MNMNYLLSTFYHLIETSSTNEQFVNRYIDLLESYLSTIELKDSSTYVVEFLGSPESGKTTTIKNILPRLTRKGFSVKYNRESAELLPDNIPKSTLQSQLWMQLHTISTLVDSLKRNENNIILVDRGISDTILWNNIFVERNQLTFNQSEKIKNLLRNVLMPHLVLIFIVSPDESIRRRGGEGKIVTREFIEQYNKTILNSCKKDLLDVPLIKLDTTNLTSDEVASIVENHILNTLNNL